MQSGLVRSLVVHTLEDINFTLRDEMLTPQLAECVKNKLTPPGQFEAPAKVQTAGHVLF
jgi:hypothetical protein